MFPLASWRGRSNEPIISMENVGDFNLEEVVLTCEKILFEAKKVNSNKSKIAALVNFIIFLL